MEDKKETLATNWVNKPKQDFKQSVQKERRKKNVAFVRKKKSFAKQKNRYEKILSTKKPHQSKNLKSKRFKLNTQPKERFVSNKEHQIASEISATNKKQTIESPSVLDKKIEHALLSKEKDSDRVMMTTAKHEAIHQKSKPKHRLSSLLKNEVKQKLKEESGYNETVFGDLNHGIDTVRATKDGVKSVVHLASQSAKTTSKVVQSSYSLLRPHQKLFLQTQQKMIQIGKWLANLIANPILLLKGLSIGSIGLLIAGLLLIIIVSITSTFSTATTKADEQELTKTWIYLTELDADTTLSIQKGKKELEINGASSNRENVQIRSNLNEVLAYLDTTYGDYELNGQVPPENQQTKTILQTLYQKMVQRTSTKEKEQVKIQPIIEALPKSEEREEQLNALTETGQFVALEELAPPLKNQEQLEVSQRYGYHVKNKKKEFFEGLAFQSEPKIDVFAPLSGEVTRKNKQLIISNKRNKVILSNVNLASSIGTSVNQGQKLGTTIEKADLTIRYEKNGASVNPSFYLPNIHYVQASDLGFSSVGGASFDENKFRSLIRLKGNAFRTKADKIIAEAKKAGVSPVIFAAIMIHESAWGTSQAIQEHNNPSGQMSSSGIIHYNSLDEGIEATGRTLQNLIIKRKLQTVERLGSVYCPVGADNDPLGLNKYWVPAIKDFMVALGGEKDMSLLWSSFVSGRGKGGKALESAYTLHKKGVKYSQGLNQRGQFPYHDCSSFVTWAMKQAGINVSLGSTEYLYSLEGTILQPISRAEVRPGDIFVWGTKGSSSGNFGHTGFFTDNGGKHILHATPATSRGFGQSGDVVETPFEGYFGDTNLAPVYFYRIAG